MIIVITFNGHIYFAVNPEDPDMFGYGDTAQSAYEKAIENASSILANDATVAVDELLSELKIDKEDT